MCGLAVGRTGGAVLGVSVGSAVGDVGDADVGVLVGARVYLVLTKHSCTTWPLPRTSHCHIPNPETH